LRLRRPAKSVVACSLRPTARIFRNARFWRVGLMFGGPPVGGPLPDVTDHVVDAVVVRRKRCYRRGALVAVAGKILMRKHALPGVRHRLAGGHKLVAPSP